MIFLCRKDDLQLVNFFSEFTHHPPIFTASRSFVHGECPVAPFPMHAISSDKVLIPHAPSRLTSRRRPTDIPPALRPHHLLRLRQHLWRQPGGELAVHSFFHPLPS